MQELKILNSKEIRRIKEKLKEQFGYVLEEDYAFLLSEKERLFIVNKEVFQIELDKLRVDKYGLYFGELRNDELRPSMEGAWLVGKKATKNIVELTKEEVKRYFLGEELEKRLGEEKRFVLLKFEEEIIGCAKYKEQKILNFLPKIHRGEVIL